MTDGAPNDAPPIDLPCLLRALDGDREVDLVRPESITRDADGTVRITGSGRQFHVAAIWSPARDTVPRWDVALDVLVHAPDPSPAGLVVALRLDATDDPHWLIPGLFYRDNGAATSRAAYPRFGTAGGDHWTSSWWSFRSDRAATPVVFGRDARRGVALATRETSGIGATGIGFSAGSEGLELRLNVPYREAPIAYDGSPDARPADLPAHDWRAGERTRIEFRVYVLARDLDARTPVLRDLHAWLSCAAPLAPWVDAAAAADLAAEGLLDWHYQADPAALRETAAFARRGDGTGAEPGDRAAMHVAWLSGAPAAAALLAHGRRTARPDAVAAGRAVLDAIASHLAPCGTFWGQWTAERGWGKGWTPGEDQLHARTLAEATLFMGRAAGRETSGGDAGPVGSWRAAVASNLEFVSRVQRHDGAIPAAWNGRTGEPGGWDGTAALAWVPALVEGAALLGRDEFLVAARRAGDRYAAFVDDGFLFGAPEDVDLGPTSEDGYVAVMAYVSLVETEPDPGRRARWLDLARRAADWTLTFRYAYNVEFEPDTLLGSYDYRTRGADQASPANQHLHAYGLVCLAEMVRLARWTGDDHYLARTRENFACFRQFIARHDGDFGARRGMAPERYLQTACFGPKGSVDPLSHAWCLGLLLDAAETVIRDHREAMG